MLKEESGILYSVAAGLRFALLCCIVKSRVGTLPKKGRWAAKTKVLTATARRVGQVTSACFKSSARKANWHKIQKEITIQQWRSGRTKVKVATVAKTPRNPMKDRTNHGIKANQEKHRIPRQRQERLGIKISRMVVQVTKCGRLNHINRTMTGVPTTNGKLPAKVVEI